MLDTRPDYVIAKEEITELVLSLNLQHSCTDAQAIVEGERGNEHVTLAYTAMVSGKSFGYSTGIEDIPWKDIRGTACARLFTYKNKELLGFDGAPVGTPAFINQYLDNNSINFTDKKAWASVCAYVARITHTQPSLVDILGSVAQDAANADMSMDDFFSEYGYDTDSRQAESIYNACRDSGKKLRAICSREVIEKLQELASRL
jgi:hypothetical protein